MSTQSRQIYSVLEVHVLVFIFSAAMLVERHGTLGMSTFSYTTTAYMHS
jgi:hypothetical protein